MIDTGASVSLTPCASDFISSIEPPRITNLHGLQGSVDIVGEGTVQWTIRDAVGVVKSIQTRAFCVPAASVRLFSPQTHFKTERNGCITLDKDGAKLLLADDSLLEFPYQPNNLPFMLTDAHFHKQAPDVSLGRTDLALLSTVTDWSSMLNVTDPSNHNLKPAQRELKLLHDKLCHADMQHLQSLCVEAAG